MYSVLPDDCRVISTDTLEVSFWANPGRINVSLSNGQQHSFFVNVISTEVGQKNDAQRVRMYESYPHDFTGIRPRAHRPGILRDNPRYALLCDFRDMINEMPEPHQFPSRLAAMHQDGKSRNGKFVFHLETFMGQLPRLAGWKDKWQFYSTKSVRLALQLDNKAKGDDPDLIFYCPYCLVRLSLAYSLPWRATGKQ